MKGIFLGLFLLSFSAVGADFILAEGYYDAEDRDSHNFIRKQLMHEGIKSIVSIELNNLGLNRDLFWQKYNEKLQERFTEIEESLKEVMKIDENTEESVQEEFLKKLRIKKLIFRRSFARMDDMLPKYSIKKVSRSQKNPNRRIIQLEGEVDRKLLNKTYYKIIRGKKTSDYGSLFIKTNYELSRVSYSELGVDNEKDFEGEISRKWLEWFNQNKPQNIATTEILSDRKQQVLSDYMKLPYEEMMANIPEAFVNSLLLNIEVVIKKTKVDTVTNEYSFTYAGHAYLKDLQTNLVIKTYSFDNTHKSYKKTEKVNIVNLVANHVYHMAKDSFPIINKHMKEIVPVTAIKKIRLADFKNIKEINNLLAMIESRGVKYSLRAKLESVSRSTASVVLYYDGDFNEVKSFLGGLQSAKKDLSFDLIESDNALGIKFNKVIETL